MCTTDEYPLCARLSRSRLGLRTPGVGHQDAFLRPRRNDRYRLSQGTLAGTRRPGGRFLPFAGRQWNHEVRHSRDIPGCADYRVAGGAVIRARLVAVSTAGLRQLVDQPVRFSRIAGVENAKYCCRSASGGLVAP